MGDIAQNCDKMFSQASEGLWNKASAYAVRLLYHKSSALADKKTRSGFGSRAAARIYDKMFSLVLH